MPTTARPRAGSALLLAAVLILSPIPVAAMPVASADPVVIDHDAMDLVCANQYPGNADFHPGQVYQVAPRDAYSWRCQRVSMAASGGTITDLAVDPGGLCSSGRAIPSSTQPPNWQCA